MIIKNNFLDCNTREELHWQRRALNQITSAETKLGYTSFDDGTVYFDDGFPRIPDIIEIRNKANEIKANINDTKYQRDRASEYPSITDQLDMLWHMMDDETIPGKNSEWYNTILLIKQQFPKPE